MGQNSGKGLEGVTKRSEERVGKIQVTGRYHRLPKKLVDDYQTTSKVLGSGYNGQVFSATRKSDGQKFAVKGFKLHGVSREKKEELETECEIFLAMDHPHVARLADVYESEDQLNLVMECMTGGELFQRVVQRKRFSERDAAEAAHQMLLAVNYIHSHGICHRDIKLENFLYEAEGSNHLKLIDFGFSKVNPPNHKMALSCGTLAYVAPEVLNHSYTSQCDMWSLGVTIFIVLFGYMPFAGSEEAQVCRIKAGQYTQKKDVWGKVSANGQDFVKKLLVVNQDMRMTADQALKHVWIAERETNDAKVLDEDIVNALQSFGQASAFRKACMSMVAWSLSNEERAAVRNAFLELDVDRTGTIKLSEFKKVLMERFHFTDENVEKTFQALDTNHKEEVYYTEFLAAMVSSRIQINDKHLKAAFSRFDVDNTNCITVDNLKKVLGESFEGHEVEELLREADSTHDGKISYEEFIQYIKSHDASEDHTQVAERVIDNELKKSASGEDPQRSVRPKTQVGNGGGGGTAEDTKPGAKTGGCCQIS